MEKKDIERINELARKKKTVGLTESEVKEQEALRRQYLSEFRLNFQDMLDRVRIEREDGSYEPLQKKSKPN